MLRPHLLSGGLLHGSVHRSEHVLTQSHYVPITRRRLICPRRQNSIGEQPRNAADTSLERDKMHLGFRAKRSP